MSFRGQPSPSRTSDLRFQSTRWRSRILLSVALAGAWIPSTLAADPPIEIRSFRINETKARLEWTGGRAPYRVQASTDSRFTWFDISEHLFSLSYETPYDAELTLFRVRTAVDFLPPAAPLGLTVGAARCDRLALIWELAEDDLDGSGVAGYRLYRDGVQISQVASPGRFFLDDRNVQPESSYTYTVTSVDRLENESAPSSGLTVVTGPCVEENGPTEQATLAWDRSETSGVSGYVVYWGLAPGNYQWAMDAMDSCSAYVPDLVPDAAYFFAVTAYDREGIQSDSSAERAFITPRLQP